MNFLPVIMTAMSMKMGEKKSEKKSYLKKQIEEDYLDNTTKQQINTNYEQLLNELNNRNFIMQVRKEIEEDNMPINRLKQCIRYKNYNTSLEILNNETLSTNELYELLAYLEFIDKSTPNSNFQNIIIRETIHQKINTLEYVLK